MSSSADPVPAIIESEANGEIGDIFQDIRAVTGVGVVNLVWRRLAITEGALPAVWTMVRPAYGSGLVAARAQEFRRDVCPPPLPELTHAALAAASVDRLGQLTIRAILDSYQRTNAINLIGLGAVLARMSADGPATAMASASPAGLAEEEPTLPPLPPLPAMSALDSHVRELVESLNSVCEQDGRIIASMYRHLAWWPGYLALIATLLAPSGKDGRMQIAIDDVRRRAVEFSRDIAAGLQPLDASLEQGVVRDINEVLTLFTQHPISKMTAICGALSSATPAPVAVS
jgi:hypothetical protein